MAAAAPIDTPRATTPADAGAVSASAGEPAVPTARLPSGPNYSSIVGFFGLVD